MARIRTIKPEFWQDEKMAMMSVLDRFVFLGLISMADDAGRLLDSVKVIDAFIFPFSDETSAGSLARLESFARLSRGATESGQGVIQITNWTKHQKVDHPNFRACLPKIVSPKHIDNSSRGIREPLAHHTNDQRPTTREHRRRRQADRPPWVAQLVEAFAPIGVFKPAKVQTECAEVVARLGVAGSLTALGYYVRHPELDRPAFFNPRGFAQKAQWCLDQSKPMSSEQGAEWIAAHPVRNGK